jgi:hypothetical protein
VSFLFGLVLGALVTGVAGYAWLFWYFKDSFK